MYKFQWLSISLFVWTKCLFADPTMGDFFSMSPAELANISVSIAVGTEKSAYQSAVVTTVITAEQI